MINRSIDGLEFVDPTPVNSKLATPFGCWRQLSVAAISCAFFSALVSPLHAQSSAAAAIELGDSRLVPAVQLRYEHNDNVFLTPEREDSSTGFRLSPSMKWVADRRNLVLNASYTGDFAQYDEEALDYNDHSLSVGSKLLFTKRFRGEAKLEFNRDHEELGTNLTQGSGSDFSEQVVYNNVRFGTSVTYGAIGAKGNIGIGLNYFDHNPINLKSLSASAEYSSIAPYIDFSLRVSSDTRLVFGVRFADIDYEVDVRDREEVTFYTGIDFAPSGKLSGSARIGLSELEYTNSTRKDDREAVLDTRLQYEPVSYSRFSLTAGRDFDLDGVTGEDSGNEGITDDFELRWRHEWSSKLYHLASLGYSRTSRDCPSRTTETSSAGVSLNYFFKRWLEFGVSILVDTRDANRCDAAAENQDDLHYDRQRVGFTVQATL